MKKFVLNHFSKFFLLISIGVLAEPDNLSDRVQYLLTMHARPTIAQVERALDPWPMILPLSEPQLQNSSLTVAEVQMVALARNIVSLEKAYPGGRYAFLGRDSVQIGQAIDAFYRSIGQPDRVVLLNASGNSIYGTNHVTLLNFLRSNGLDPRTIDNDHPFVIIDNTNYNTNSQSRELLASFYEEYVAQGGNLKNLIQKVAVVGTQSQGTLINPKTDLGNFFQSNSNGNGVPPRILSIDAVTSAGTYTAEWHGYFGKFIQDSQGKTVAPPGYDNSPTHSQILLSLFQWINTVRSPAFLKKINETADEFGLRFPWKGDSNKYVPLTKEEFEALDKKAREARIKAKEERFKAMKAEFKNMVANFSELGPDKEPFSDNGNSLYQWISSNALRNQSEISSKWLILFSLEGTIRAFENKKISPRDFRRIIKRVLAFYPKQTIGFDGGFKKLFESSSTLQKVWQDKKDYFLETGHKSGPEGSKNYLRLDEILRGTCVTKLEEAG